jgi:hypothetical protein
VFAIGFPSGKWLVPPSEDRSLEPSTRGVLPLGLRRELLACPGGVGLGVLVGDMHDRVAVATVDRGSLASRPAPVRAGEVGPPVPVVVETHRPRCRVEDERAGDKQVGIGVGVLLGVERPLRDGHVSRLTHEAPELGGRDGLLVHPEPVDVDLELVQPEEVVTVRGPPVLHVEHEAAEGAALADDHAVRASFRDRDLRRDRM